MNFYTKIAILAVLYSSFSCTKGGGNIYVEGRVYNPVTGEGIPNVTLNLYRPEMGGTIGNSSGNKTVETAQTDDEGYYEISHLGGAYTYRLKIVPEPDRFLNLGTAPNDFDVEIGNDAFIVDKGTNMTVDFFATYYGKLRYEINNVNCQGSTDNFKLFFMGTEVGYQNDHIGVVTIEGDGCFESNDNTFAEVPMGDRYYKIEITKNGQTTSYLDTITIQEGQEYVYEINY